MSRNICIFYCLLHSTINEVHANKEEERYVGSYCTIVASRKKICCRYPSNQISSGSIPRFLVFQEFHEPDRVKVKITLLFRRKISANVNRIHENRQRGREREREVRERLQQPFHIPSREIPSRRNFDPVHRKIDFSRTRNPSLSPFAIIVTNTSRETIVGERMPNARCLVFLARVLASNLGPTICPTIASQPRYAQFLR